MTLILQEVELNTEDVIGQLDSVISEFLHLTTGPSLTVVECQTLKHHAEDMIGAGTKALATLQARDEITKKQW